jgi:hypothetical protein
VAGSSFYKKYLMAVIIKTTKPEALLKSIKKAIDEGHVVTWRYDGDGDFTHKLNQWDGKAWLTPKLYSGELRLGILGIEGVKLSKEVYAVYHGRFIEMVLPHFDKDFENALATATKT